ncbi:molybdopterin-binding protein [Sphingomonadaceae bacterium]|nr:molybdopterin-binding protein [Sphingomonadaceae bacterium]
MSDTEKQGTGKQGVGRRGILAGMAALLVSGCTKIGQTDFAQRVFSSVADWHKNTHRLLSSRKALVNEYDVEDISPVFRANGSTNPQNGGYPEMAEAGFVDWRVEVSGLVDNPMSLSLEDIRALPQRTQITRHDCVEGWSAIGQWTGPQLSTILEAAGVQDGAKFVVFRCADNLAGRDYYESVDMIDALHPQTIVAHELNGEAVPVPNGAPLRMRVERQLGYKQAKYLTGIEVVESVADIGDGKGGYWEDRSGYQWYAGI